MWSAGFHMLLNPAESLVFIMTMKITKWSKQKLSVAFETEALYRTWCAAGEKYSTDISTFDLIQYQNLSVKKTNSWRYTLDLQEVPRTPHNLCPSFHTSCHKTHETTSIHASIQTDSTTHNIISVCLVLSGSGSDEKMKRWLIFIRQNVIYTAPIKQMCFSSC